MTQDAAEGDSRELKASLHSSRVRFRDLNHACWERLVAAKNKPPQIDSPNIFEHVEHLRREMRGGHVKLRKVSFQHWRRGSFSYQCWHHLVMQYTAGQKEWLQGNEKLKNGHQVNFHTYFLAMLCIICLFFKLGRVDEDVPTREKVDCETWADRLVFSHHVLAAGKRPEFTRPTWLGRALTLRMIFLP